MNELSLFTGAGGGVLGTKLLGFNHIGYVEINDYCQRILKQRIKDGYLDNAPIFGDIRTFISEGYAESYKGLVDVVTAGFPCQPFSVAGKQRGEDDERDMWPSTRDVICIVRPKELLLENVANILAFEYFGQILRDLAEMGYITKWGVLSGKQCVAAHLRERTWIYATNNGKKRMEGVQQKKVYRFKGLPWGQDVRGVKDLRNRSNIPQPIIRRINDACSRGMDRLSALGNMQIPIVVKTAWELLND